MSPTEHVLEAMASLQRARSELDRLWLACAPHCDMGAEEPLDFYVRDVVTELVAVHGALEAAVEGHLRATMEVVAE